MKIKDKLSNITKREWIFLISALVVGLFFGRLFFHTSSAATQAENSAKTEHVHEHEGGTIWTCSMHPQIRKDKPGKCPICGMTLIPLKKDDEGDNLPENAISFSESAIKLAEIQTIKVKLGAPHNKVRLFGKIKPDETRISELTARYAGRIEKLFVNFTGQNLRKGERLASIYSPELITAQKELLEAVKIKNTNPEIFNAAFTKLKLWSLSDKQINDIIDNKKVQLYFNILSPISGTVTMRHVAVGDYIKERNQLFQVIDLNRLWVIFDAYEQDLPWLRLGQKVKFTVQSFPGKSFSGKISFIDPFLNPKTRVAGVRVIVNNPGLKLKPEMFVNGIVNATIEGAKDKIMIPKSAILWTGKRSVVYVKVANTKRPTFSYREVTLGAEAGNFYVIEKGLSQTEEIAVNGVFKIDAAAQLAGLPNMMSPPEKKIEHKSVEKVKPSTYFKKKLSNLLEAYITLKDYFVASDAENVAKASMQVLKVLNSIEMKSLSEKEHMAFMKNKSNIEKSLHPMMHVKNIDNQRKSLKPLSEAVIALVKPFHIQSSKYFIEFCPMADDTKGAFWISQWKKIKNPYFGQQMLDCGDFRDSL